MSITVYGIKNCDTVRKALRYLEDKQIHYDFIDFKKIPVSESTVKRWRSILNAWPINPKGRTYKQYQNEFDSGSAKEKLQLLQTQPAIMKRPIIEVDDETLCMGFNPSEYDALFG